MVTAFGPVTFLPPLQSIQNGQQLKLFLWALIKSQHNGIITLNSLILHTNVNLLHPSQPQPKFPTYFRAVIP